MLILHQINHQRRLRGQNAVYSADLLEYQILELLQRSGNKIDIDIRAPGRQGHPNHGINLLQLFNDLVCLFQINFYYSINY